MDYKAYIGENEKWIEETWNKVERKFSKVALRSREKLPYTAINGVHDDMDCGKVDWWTNGFWGGLMWLMYSETKKDVYKDTAVCSEKLLDEALKDYKCLHHDVGFMWHILSGAHYRLLKNEASCNRNLYAAATLASRFNIDGGFIRAWNGEGTEGKTIIDSLMNLPLLYWASEEIGDDRFKRIAMRHADMALCDHIHADGSVSHIVEHNVDTGEFIKTHTGQGYSENSCWSRGCAWAIYGMVLSYTYTGKKEYLDAAVNTADYFIKNCAATDYKTLVDFCQPPQPIYYDSTAGVCAACGMIEIAKHVSEDKAREYTESAIKILKATDENFCDYDENTDALVLYGTERYPRAGTQGVHIPIIYGDFFFVEAMLKLKGSSFLIW